MPFPVILLAIGWIGLFAVCTIVPDRAFSAPDPVEAPAVYSSGRVLHVGPARRQNVFWVRDRNWTGTNRAQWCRKFAPH